MWQLVWSNSTATSTSLNHVIYSLLLLRMLSHVQRRAHAPNIKRPTPSCWLACPVLLLAATEPAPPCSYRGLRLCLLLRAEAIPELLCDV
jgi:hypothetical protein